MTTFSTESRAILKTSQGDLTLEFLFDKAPRAAENFVKLARKGFYEGLTFHRIIKGFMVQGGCPKGDGTGNPGYTIRAEFNDTPHVKGVVSMARGTDPHSAGSQFFVVHGDSRYLDSRYTAFARVVDGLDVLDRIASVPVVENRYKEASQPRDPVFINRIVLEGIEFDAHDDAPRGGPHGEGRGEPHGAADGDDEGGGGDGDGDGEDEDEDEGGDEPAGGEPAGGSEPRADAEAEGGTEGAEGEGAPGEGGGAQPGGGAGGGKRRRRGGRRAR